MFMEWGDLVALLVGNSGWRQHKRGSEGCYLIRRFPMPSGKAYILPPNLYDGPYSHFWPSLR